MKKSFFLIVFSLLLLPFISNSQVVTIENPLNATSFEAVIDNVITFLTWVALALAPLVAIIGAFFIMTSGGDPKQIDQGKKIIFYALIALVIIVFAKGVIILIKMILRG